MIEPGQQIGRYEVQRRLGRGGMGTVYLAHDPVLKRSVAIKLLLADIELPDARERFVREARSAAALNHANIVTVHELGEFSAQPYIVMEYVVGSSLAEVIARKAPLSLLEKLRWLDDLCAGVAFAHEMRVLHRDLKPTNLMIDRSGRLKIVDFGIARMLGTLSTTGLTGGGTPGYMAPEQIRGEVVDTRSDIFSIGAVCYELLSYTEAFPGDTIPTISYRVLTTDPKSLSELVVDLDPELVEIVERALAKSVDARFPDASTLRSALAGVARRLELSGLDGAGLTMAIPRPTGSRPGSSPPRPSGDLRSPVGVTPAYIPRPSTGGEGGLVAQIRSALERARSLLEIGDLDGASIACERALALDDASPEVLEVERAIRAAAARRRAKTLIQEARELLGGGALDEAQARLEQARGLNTELGECARLESDLRLARRLAEQLPRHTDADATVIAPARTPRASDPRIANADTVLPISRRTTPAQTVYREPVPRTTPSPVGSAPLKPTTGGVSSTVATVTEAKPTTSPVRVSVATRAAATVATAGAAVRQHQRLALAAAAVAIVAVAGLVWATNRVAPTGTGVIDAVPWGTVTAIRGVDGTSHTVPAGGATPLVVVLPEGTYDATVTGPGGIGDAKQVTFQIGAAAVGLAPVVQFSTVAVEDYFESYLAAPVDLAAPAEAPETTTPVLGGTDGPPLTSAPIQP